MVRKRPEYPEDADVERPHARRRRVAGVDRRRGLPVSALAQLTPAGAEPSRCIRASAAEHRDAAQGDRGPGVAPATQAQRRLDQRGDGEKDREVGGRHVPVVVGHAEADEEQQVEAPQVTRPAACGQRVPRAASGGAAPLPPAAVRRGREGRSSRDRAATRPGLLSTLPASKGSLPGALRREGDGQARPGPEEQREQPGGPERERGGGGARDEAGAVSPAKSQQRDQRQDNRRQAELGAQADRAGQGGSRPTRSARGERDGGADDASDSRQVLAPRDRQGRRRGDPDGGSDQGGLRPALAMAKGAESDSGEPGRQPGDQVPPDRNAERRGRVQPGKDGCEQRRRGAQDALAGPRPRSRRPGSWRRRR